MYEQYTHAVVQRDILDDIDKVVIICTSWIEAHNYLARNGRKGMRIVEIESINIKTKELREKEAEEYGKGN